MILVAVDNLQEVERKRYVVLSNIGATMRIRVEILGSYVMDYSDLGKLQWSSLLKFTKTSKRLC